MAAWYQNKVEMGCVWWLIIVACTFVVIFVIAAVLGLDFQTDDTVEKVQLLGARLPV